MENDKSYLFRIGINPDLSDELMNSINDAITEEFHVEDVVSYEGPPEGAFGFGDGFINFLKDTWADIIKMPKLIEKIADGIHEFLLSRPNMVITIELESGTKININAKASGDEVANILKNIKYN